MRTVTIALALALAGCYGDSIRPPAEPQDQAGDEGTEVAIDPDLLSIPTSELGTERTRGIAKSIEWVNISTEEGQTYADEKIVVDRILRDDAENHYAVRVRLKNTTKDVMKLTCVIRLYNRHGGQIASYIGGIGSAERWQGLVIEPYGVATISDFARTIGAEGFKLYVKGAGGSADGSPDDPSDEGKDERRRKKEEEKEKKEK